MERVILYKGLNIDEIMQKIKSIQEVTSIDLFPVTIIRKTKFTLGKESFLKQNLYSLELNNLNEVIRFSNMNEINLNHLIQKHSIYKSNLKRFKEFFHLIKDNLQFINIETKISFNVLLINNFEYASHEKGSNSRLLIDSVNYYELNFTQISKNFSEKISIPYLFITNKVSKCLYNDCISMKDHNPILKLLSNLLINKETENKVQTIKNNNNFTQFLSYCEFKNYLKKLKKVHFSSTNSYMYFNKVELEYKKKYLIDKQNQISIIYSLPIINDKVYNYVGSNLHKFLYSKSSQNIPLIKRFNCENKNNMKSNILEKYQKTLSSLSIKTEIELRKKTNYDFSNFSREYIFKNSLGKINNNDVKRTYQFNEIFKNLKDLKKTEITQLKDDVSPLKNIRLKTLYKVYKSKKIPDFSLECESLDLKKTNLEFKLGTNYLFYVNDLNLDLDRLDSIFYNLISISQFYNRINIPLVLGMFTVLPDEVCDQEIQEHTEHFREFKEIQIFIVRDYNKKFKDFVYSYPNCKSFLFIDKYGLVNNFCFNYNLMLLNDKIEKLLYRKHKIDEKCYYSLKNYLKKSIIDYKYYTEFDYKPTFKISLEKRSVYNHELKITDQLYYLKSVIKVYDIDNHKFLPFENDINNLLSYHGFIFDIKYYKTIIPTKRLELDLNKLLCKICGKDCGFNSVYFCPTCDSFLCETCANEQLQILKNDLNEKDDEEKESTNENVKMKLGDCLYHNYIFIFDIQSTRDNNKNLYLNKLKIGFNMFKTHYKFDGFLNSFICNICRNNFNDERFVCLNCKETDVLYDNDYAGYCDICKNCVKNFSDYFKSENKNDTQNIFSLIEKEMKNSEFHDVRNHVYLRIPFSTGNYYYH